MTNYKYDCDTVYISKSAVMMANNLNLPVEEFAECSKN